MVVQAYAVCIRVMLECRRTESETVGDGWGCVDKVYHDITPLLCCYISERHSASLMLGAVGCSWVSECVLKDGLQLVSARRLREASLLVLGEELLLKR